MDHMTVSPRDRGDRPDRIEAVQVRLWNDVQQATGSLHRTRNFGAGGQLFPIFQKEVMKFFVTPVTFDRHTDGCQ